MWIVKLGGSLWDAPALGRWLRALAAPQPGVRLVVPGGGPFAQAVRTAQPTLGFGDRAAHGMAILAMAQYGRALLDREADLLPIRDEADLDRLRRAGGAGLWLTSGALGAAAEAELPASWEVTSDSLALWLAIRSGAQALVLVKSADVAPGEATAAALARGGLVDAHLPTLLPALACPAWAMARDVAWPGCEPTRIAPLACRILARPAGRA